MKRLISLLLTAALLTAPALAVQEIEESALPLAASDMAVVGDVLYVADSYHRSVWAVEDGEASLLAGRTDVTDLSGQPVAGYGDGSFDKAVFSEPWAVVPYLDDLLVSDTGNHVLRYLDLEKERVYTAAGTGEAGYRDGSNSRVSFHSPTGLAVDNEGTMYIADTGNGAVRVIQDGYVTTLAELESGSTYPVSSRGLLLSGDVLYVGNVFARVLFACGTQAPEMPFADVAEGSWYYNGVRFAWANDILQGTGEGVFSPQTVVTRATSVTALARLAGANTDQSEPWYETGRQWAVDNSISDGTGMAQAITREQLAAMLYRYGQSLGLGFTGAWAFPLDCPDADAVSDYAYEAMCWVTMHDIIRGAEGVLDPQGPVTRAQLAVILQRFAEVCGAA